MSKESDDLRTQLAAMTAERDALDARCRMIVSHATMGHTDGEDLSVNQISVQITALRNELYQEAKAEGRKEGLREAAAIARDRHKAWTGAHGVECDVTACADISLAILDAAEKEAK